MKYILKISILLLLTTKAFYHPHTFIEVQPTIEIKNEEINKFNIKWTLDEMTSMMLIMELDKNANGKFEKDENDYIYDSYFLSLEKQNFYMSINSNKQELIAKPQSFKASIKNNRLIYSFNIQNNISLKDLKINFQDEELFVGMMLEKEYIKINGIKKEKHNKLKTRIFGVN